MYWGYHLIGNFARCSSAIKCAPSIALFSKTLVTRIDMIPYGEPQVVHFGSGNKAGYTLVQLIETSNITAHFVEETGDVYLDVFSCKPFDKDTVVDVFNSYFKPEFSDVTVIKRQAKNELLV
jgi:S-adenosylmethionine/arginine decarboxylase-like enzyme